MHAHEARSVSRVFTQHSAPPHRDYDPPPAQMSMVGELPPAAAATKKKRRGMKQRKMSFSTSFEMRQRKKRWSVTVNSSRVDGSGIQGSAGVVSGGQDQEKILGMTRSSRASLGQIYIPGDVRWSGDEPEGDDDGEGGGARGGGGRTYQFPWWWFIIMPLEAAPCWVFGTALWAIIWPAQIKTIFGDHEKMRVLGLLSTVGNTLGWSAPFLGTLSDRFPQRWAERWGRRRPFILVGQSICAFSLLITYLAVRPYLRAEARGETLSTGAHGTLMLLLISNVVGSIGGNLEGPAWGAVWYDTIPAKQRGLMRTVEGVFCTACCMLGDLVGWAVGQKMIEPETIFLIYIGVEFYRVPLKLIACSGEAGCCKPEFLPPPKPPSRPALDPHNPRNSCWKKGPGVLWRETVAFFSAFEEASFRWMWIQCFTGHIAGQIAWCFSFYFYQDCFPDGYWLFGWKIANNVKSLVAINGLIGNIIQLSIKWSGEWWRVRWGERAVCIWAGVFGCWATLSYPIYMMYVPHAEQKYLYTLCLFWQVWGSMMGGISSVAGGVLWMSILPSHEDGRAKNAGRDNNVLGFHSRIPDTFLPLLIGHAMTWFHGSTEVAAHRKGFICFFWIGGLLGLVSFLMFVVCVHPRFEELDVRPVCGTRCQCTRRWFAKDTDLKRRAQLRQEGKPTFMIDRLYPDLVVDPQMEPPPAPEEQEAASPEAGQVVRRSGAGPGARCCDRLLFGADRRRGMRSDGEGGQKTRTVSVGGPHNGAAMEEGEGAEETQALLAARKKSTPNFSNVQ